MLTFDATICHDLQRATEREWLVTNGLGGYAAGTLSGVLARSYHGLLIAALKPPLERTLLLAKLNEIVAYAGETYPLYTDRPAPGKVEPEGYRHLEQFRLEGTTPVWTFVCGDARLEKRLWMQPGANTTYVQYTLREASAPLRLTLRALVSDRDHHAVTTGHTKLLQLTPIPHGLRVQLGEQGHPWQLLCPGATVTLRDRPAGPYFLSVEAYRGLKDQDTHLHAADFTLTLGPGEQTTVIASAELEPLTDGNAAYENRRVYEHALLERARAVAAPPAYRQLVLAADQFIVRRDLPDAGEGRTIIAGYPWFTDWGRDTMIALSGLTLTTGRPDVARRILHTFARFVDQGMLPNTFPEIGAEPGYNTVDATLWYVEAIRAYVAAAGDEALLRELFPVLRDIVAWHWRGTRYRIHVDPADGLLYAGEPGVQLTWMDAKVGDWVVTPRIGKPVEINALWYNALRILAAFARQLGEPDEEFTAAADQVQASFARFWNTGTGYCYDVLDGPAGHDPALRPNQLFAVALTHSPLAPPQQRAVVDACARALLTPCGLRSLAPDDPAYVGHYGGDQRRRDAAYHQGTVWGWLIGPFVAAHLHAYGDPAQARAYLTPLLEQLQTHAVGTLSEIFDGDAPFTPRGCFAQAWTVAEALRVWALLNRAGQSEA